MTTTPEELRVGGRGGRAPQTGLFIKAYLVANGQGFPADIHRAYLAFYRKVKPLTRRGRPFRLGTYHSFLQYFARCHRLGLIDLVRQERTPNWNKTARVGWHSRGSRFPRHYYRLTTLGRSQEDPWQNPNRAEAARARR